MIFASIILYRFNKWHIGRLARAERIMLYRGTFVDAVADAGTESEGLFLGGKCFGFGEIERVFLGEIGFEAIDVVVGNQVDCRLVSDDVNFNIHTFSVWDICGIIPDFFA